MDDNYVVVHFYKDETVEAVPSFWFHGKKLCAWPKNKALVSKFIISKHAPNDKEFKYLKARILHKNIATLERARKIADRAKFTSDFSLTEDETVHMRPSSPSSSTSSVPLFSSSDVENESKMTTESILFKHVNESNTEKNPAAAINQIETDKDTSECLKQILRNLTFLKYEIKQILSNQVTILQKLDETEKYLEQKPISFDKIKIQNSIDLTDCPLPLNNMVDLTILEDKISGNQNLKNQLVIELSYIGGKNVKILIKRIMSRLFSDGLLSCYSFTGKKGKAKFSSLILCSVVFDAVKQTKFMNTPLNEIEEILKYILAQAPFNKKRSDAKQK